MYKKQNSRRQTTAVNFLTSCYRPCRKMGPAQGFKVWTYRRHLGHCRTKIDLRIRVKVFVRGSANNDPWRRMLLYRLPMTTRTITFFGRRKTYPLTKNIGGSIVDPPEWMIGSRILNVSKNLQSKVGRCSHFFATAGFARICRSESNPILWYVGAVHLPTRKHD